jgi:hypothetical protein
MSKIEAEKAEGRPGAVALHAGAPSIQEQCRATPPSHGHLADRPRQRGVDQISIEPTATPPIVFDGKADDVFGSKIRSR